MSSPVVGWVWRHSKVRGVDRLVLLVYAEFADDVGENTYPGARVVAEWAQCDLGTARTSTERLLANGDIALVRQGGGRGNRNEYRVVMDAPGRDKGGRTAPVSPEPSGGDVDQAAVSAAQEAAAASDVGVDDSEVVHRDSVETPRDLAGHFDKGGRTAPLSGPLNARETREKRAGFGGPNTPLSSADPSHTYTDTENPPTPRSDELGEAANEGSAPRAVPTGEQVSIEERVAEAIEQLAELEADKPGALDGYHNGRSSWLTAKRHELHTSIDLITGRTLSEQLRDLALALPPTSDLFAAWIEQQRIERWREPLERRGRMQARWCTDPTESSYRSFEGLDDDALEEILRDDVAQLIDPRWSPDKPEVDDQLFTIAVTAFRHERARLIEQQHQEAS